MEISVPAGRESLSLLAVLVGGILRDLGMDEEKGKQAGREFADSCCHGLIISGNNDDKDLHCSIEREDNQCLLKIWSDDIIDLEDLSGRIQKSSHWKAIIVNTEITGDPSALAITIRIQ